MAKTNVLGELFEEGREVLPEPLVHTMIRGIATTAIPIGDALTIDEVDADVSAWVARGYKLVNTHLIGVDVNSINMVYVLSK